MVDRTCLSVKSGLAAKKLAVSPFCLDNIYVAQFGLVSLLSPLLQGEVGIFWNVNIKQYTKLNK